MAEKIEHTDQDKENTSQDSSIFSPDSQEAAGESSVKTQAPAAVQDDAPDQAPVSAVQDDAQPEEDSSTSAEEDQDAPLTLSGTSGDETPERSVPAPEKSAVPSGPAAKLFNALSFAGLPLLIVFAAAMTFLEVWQVRDLWFSDEVRLADAFMNLGNGDWLMLTMNGLPYPDKPPLYFWFMETLTRIPGVTVPMVFFLAVAVSHVLFIGSI